MLDSTSPKVSPGKSNDVNKRKNFRLQAVQEILTSERSYINQLQILMKYFVNPLKDMDILSNDEFTILFGQIEMIYNLNTELLKNLESDLSKVGKAFLRLAPFFKLYSVYAFDYNRSQIVLQVYTIVMLKRMFVVLRLNFFSSRISPKKIKDFVNFWNKMNLVPKFRQS